jgi:flavin-dependent dehydrogenase
MPQKKEYDVIIVGGGLAGLSSAIHLSQQGIRVLLLEKNEYPNHKVCGEYVSNEVIPYLNSLGIDPFNFGAKKIDRLSISTKEGGLVQGNLPLGGFGLSRYAFDRILFEKAQETCDILHKAVAKIEFNKENFYISTICGNRYTAPYVVGAHGKRSNLDKMLNRSFMERPAPWLAVKAHYNADFPDDLVALHTFDGGYCGLSKTETGSVNVCYMVRLEVFRKIKDIALLEQQVLSKNIHLKRFFDRAELLFEKRETISQISFQKKESVKDHIFMIGDSAGLIHPLCGNGMAMAIRGAQLFSQCYLDNKAAGRSRSHLEKAYRKAWRKVFSSRMRTGAILQKVLLNETATQYALRTLERVPSLLPRIIAQTHGKAIA